MTYGLTTKVGNIPPAPAPVAVPAGRAAPGSANSAARRVRSEQLPHSFSGSRSSPDVVRQNEPLGRTGGLSTCYKWTGRRWPLVSAPFCFLPKVVVRADEICLS